MSTPSSSPASFPSGTSASAGITMGSVSVNLAVTPQSNKDIVCTVTCKGRDVVVNFQGDGDISSEVKKRQRP
jgi:hypothetical protein